jgi:hypothetical protein
MTTQKTQADLGLGYPGRSLVTVANFAALVGVSQQAVRKALAAGRLTAKIVNGRTLFDPLTALAEFEANRQRARTPSMKPEAHPPPAGPAGTDPAPSDLGATAQALREARLRTERAKAEKQELETERLKGNLVEAAAVRAAGTDIGTLTRAEFESLADQLAPELAAELDTDRIHTLLEVAIENTLLRIAKASRRSLDRMTSPS